MQLYSLYSSRLHLFYLKKYNENRIQIKIALYFKRFLNVIYSCEASWISCWVLWKRDHIRFCPAGMKRWSSSVREVKCLISLALNKECFPNRFHKHFLLLVGHIDQPASKSTPLVEPVLLFCYVLSGWLGCSYKILVLIVSQSHCSVHCWWNFTDEKHIGFSASNY